MNALDKFAERATLSRLALAVMTAFAVLTPLFVHLWSGSDFFFGEAQYNIRLAQIGLWQGLLGVDPLSAQPLAYTLYHALLNMLFAVMSPVLAVVTVGFAAAFISVLSLRRILTVLGFSQLRALVACAVVVSTPGFVFLFGTANVHSMAFAMVMFGIMLLICVRGFLAQIAGVMLFGFAALVGPEHALVGFFVLLGALFMRRRPRMILFVVSYALGALMIYRALFMWWRPVQAQFPFGIFSELGFEYGLGIFLVLTALVGVYVLWKRRAEFWQAYMLLFLLAVSVFSVSYIFSYYFMFVCALFSTVAITRFIEGKWELSSLRNATLLLIVCGSLFSFFSYANVLSQKSYDPGLDEALHWLANTPQGSVLSAREYGYLIERISAHPAVLTARTQGEQILHLRNPDLVRALFERQGIRYVVIDRKMRDGLVWSRQDQGLQFALKNAEFFEVIYHKDDVEIWVFNP